MPEYYIKKYVKCEYKSCEGGLVKVDFGFINPNFAYRTCSYCHGEAFKKVFVPESKEGKGGGE